MAYSIIQSRLDRYQNGKQVIEISAVLDSIDDLASLGTDYAPGSVALVADKGAPVYMLNASGVWKEI